MEIPHCQKTCVGVFKLDRQGPNAAGRSPSVGEAHQWFDAMLTTWASDWLRLMARRQDRPTTDGRQVLDSPRERPESRMPPPQFDNRLRRHAA